MCSWGGWVVLIGEDVHSPALPLCRFVWRDCVCDWSPTANASTLNMETVGQQLNADVSRLRTFWEYSSWFEERGVSDYDVRVWKKKKKESVAKTHKCTQTCSQGVHPGMFSGKEEGLTRLWGKTLCTTAASSSGWSNYYPSNRTCLPLCCSPFTRSRQFPRKRRATPDTTLVFMFSSITAFSLSEKEIQRLYHGRKVQPKQVSFQKWILAVRPGAEDNHILLFFFSSACDRKWSGPWHANLTLSGSVWGYLTWTTRQTDRFFYRRDPTEC